VPITEKEKNQLIEILGKLNTDMELIRFSGLIYNTFIQAKLPSDALLFLGKQIYAGVPWEKIPNKVRIMLFKATEEFTIKFIPLVYEVIPENQSTPPAVDVSQEISTAPDGLPELPSEFQMEAAHMGGSAGTGTQTTPPAGAGDGNLVPTATADTTPATNHSQEKRRKQGQQSQSKGQGQSSSAPSEPPPHPASFPNLPTLEAEEDDSGPALNMENGEIVEVTAAKPGNGESREGKKKKPHNAGHESQSSRDPGEPPQE